MQARRGIATIMPWRASGRIRARLEGVAGPGGPAGDLGRFQGSVTRLLYQLDPHSVRIDDEDRLGLRFRNLDARFGEDAYLGGLEFAEEGAEIVDAERQVGEAQGVHRPGVSVAGVTRRGVVGAASIAFGEVDRVITIGSDRMMAAVGAARHGVLAPHIPAGHKAIASINSPMQCMMKEICAQCLQPHRDPETGQETVVFSCFNQDQPLDCVDFAGLGARLRQNAVQEKLTAQWIDHCLRALEVRPAAE